MPALAVDQHQHLVRTEVAQLGRAHEVREIRIRLARQVERRHQRLDGRPDFAGNRRGPANRLGCHQVDRREALVEAAARCARADDDDLFQFRLDLLRERGTRDSSTTPDAPTPKADRTAARKTFTMTPTPR